MITEAAPEGFQSEVHMTEYGTDDYSEVELEYPGGCSAHCIQAIGKKLERHAKIEGTKGDILMDDFQHLQEFAVHRNVRLKPGLYWNLIAVTSNITCKMIATTDYS